jgi:hypothetical protein
VTGHPHSMVIGPTLGVKLQSHHLYKFVVYILYI